MNYIVYIGTYTDSESEGIYTNRFNMANGGLTHLFTTPGIDEPSFLEISSDGCFLFAASEVAEVEGTSGGAIVSFTIDQQSAALTRLNHESTRGNHPCHLNLDKSNSFVLVANYMGGNLAVLPILGDGSLGPATDVVQHRGTGPNCERQEAAHAHSITVSPNNKYAYAADLGMDKIMIYALDLENGKLVPTEQPYVSVDPGEGPRHFDFHPNGRYAYLINELGDSIVGYDYDSESGSLKQITSVPTLPADFNGISDSADIHVHPNGKFLYGTNRGHDSLVMCSIDQNNGKLKVLGHKPTGGRYPRNFAIDPTGTYLLVANRDTNDITTFAINNETGILTRNGQVAQVPHPVCIKFMEAPAGRQGNK